MLLAGLVAPRPAFAYWKSTVDFEGHGWGHGRGLGQYGALGYATQGQTYTWVLDHYYGGTHLAGDAGNPPISVHITRKDGIGVQVEDAAQGSGVYVERVGVNQFKVHTGPGCAGPWNDPAPVAGPVHIDPASGATLALCDLDNTKRLYRGRFEVLEGGGTNRLINYLDSSTSTGTQDYLYGVVPRESPAWFHAEALKAQAVAARSYALAGNRDPYANQCDTTVCQVYGGKGYKGGETLEAASTNAAVDATNGQVRRFDSTNAIASTEFSSSTGGWTAGGTFPAVVDDGDSVSSNPNHYWNASVTVGSIEAAWPSVGSLVSVIVTKRNGLGDWGGRATEVRVEGTSGVITTTGSTFRSKVGLKSDWFRVTTDWESLGGAVTSGPATASWGPGRLDVFARGTDGQLWHKWYTGAWAGWEPLGGSLASDPAVVSWGPNRIDVFARSASGALLHRWWDGSQWRGWETLPGSMNSAPAVASWQAGRLDVFAKGADGTLIHKWYDGGWSGWESLGGVLTSDPAAVSWGPGRLDVFARGTDGQLWHKWYDGTWRWWEPLGGGLQGGPDVAAWAAGRLDVFVRGTDNQLWRKWWDGTGWYGWEPLFAPVTVAGSGLVSDPASVSWGPGRIDVFGHAFDGAVWHKWYDAGKWSG